MATPEARAVGPTRPRSRATWRGMTPTPARRRATASLPSTNGTIPARPRSTASRPARSGGWGGGGGDGKGGGKGGLEADRVAGQPQPQQVRVDPRQLEPERPQQARATGDLHAGQDLDGLRVGDRVGHRADAADALEQRQVLVVGAPLGLRLDAAVDIAQAGDSVDDDLVLERQLELDGLGQDRVLGPEGNDGAGHGRPPASPAAPCPFVDGSGGPGTRVVPARPSRPSTTGTQASSRVRPAASSAEIASPRGPWTQPSGPSKSRQSRPG